MIQSGQACFGTASLKNLDGIQNLEDAYQLAVELENSATNAIFEFVISGSQKPLESLSKLRDSSIVIYCLSTGGFPDGE